MQDRDRFGPDDGDDTCPDKKDKIEALSMPQTRDILRAAGISADSFGCIEYKPIVDISEIVENSENEARQ